MGRARGGPERAEDDGRERDGDDGRLGMETGHGDWAWRPERAEDDGGRAWRQGTVIRKGLRVRRLAGGRCR